MSQLDLSLKSHATRYMSNSSLRTFGVGHSVINMFNDVWCLMRERRRGSYECQDVACLTDLMST